MRYFQTLLICVLTVACSHVRPPPFPQPPADTHMCGPACDRMASLGCPEGAPLDADTSCEKFCVVTQEAGHALNPTCLASISTCGEIESKCLFNRSK